MLHKTIEARDQAAAKSDEAGVPHVVLKGREETCPLAGGKCDTDVHLDGVPISKWLKQRCNTRGLPFSLAHRRAHKRIKTLPPVEQNECEYGEQFSELALFGGPKWVNLVHATHQFAHLPQLRYNTNLAFDECPDFTVDTSQDRFRQVVTAYLQETRPTFRGQSIDTFDELVSLTKRFDVSIPEQMPNRDWFVETPDAHIHAPAFARAIARSKESPRGNRIRGVVLAKAPNLSQHSQSPSLVCVTVVLNNDYTIRTLRVVPVFGTTRSLIGLDAHPCEPLWQLNTRPFGVEHETVLSSQERRKWRQEERGLRIVQVGENTLPLTTKSGVQSHFNNRHFRALVSHINDSSNESLSTCITSKSAESRVRQILQGLGINNVRTMHYGEEKSRNDFAGESVGLVYGCIEPNDDQITDLLAEFGADASIKMKPCGSCAGSGCAECGGVGTERKTPREFEGPDSEIAEQFRMSVRENRVIQAAGRHARNPDDGNDRATVFLVTSAVNPEFVDEVISIELLSAYQQAVIRELRQAGSEGKSAREIATQVSASKNSVASFLDRLVDEGYAVSRPKMGKFGATLYNPNPKTPDGDFMVNE